MARVLPANKLLHGSMARVLSLLAGGLAPFAFAPFELSLIIFPVLTLLFYHWTALPEKEAALRGYLFGLGMFGFGCSWVFVSMYRFGDMDIFSSGALTLLFVAFLALFPALAGFGVARLKQGLNSYWLLLLLSVIVWTACELLRGWVFGGFPWLNVGVSQMEMPLSGYAPVFGVYGVSLIVALSSALLLGLLSKGKKGWPYGVALVVVWLGGWGLQQVTWTEPLGEPIKVSVMQGNIAQEQKWMPNQRYPTYELYTELTRGHWDSDLVVWPETAMTVFLHQLEPVMEEFMAEANEHNTDVITGVPVYEFPTQRYYNGVAAFNETTSYYYKRHLVPFGEYIPFHEFLGNLLGFMNIPMTSFSAGNDGQDTLHAAGVEIGASICFEIAFAEEMIDPLPKANLLVNLSNDAWFDGSLAPFQHLQMARMRALETERWILRATNTGISAVIDHQGTIRSASPQNEVYVVTDMVQPRAGATPYVRMSNWPVIVLVVLFLAFAVFRVRQVKSVLARKMQ